MEKDWPDDISFDDGGSGMNRITTDCRTEEGITIGLIDSIITLCRIIKARELLSLAINEALKDLGSDEDFEFLYRKSKEAT